MLFSFIYLVKDLLFFFGMVTTRGNFKKPLTEAEEKAVLQKYFEGNQEARNTLIEHNLRLVSHIVRKYRVPSYTQEDLVSVGTVGLIKAVNTFKQSAGIKLSTYAARCIENEVLMLLRASKKRAQDVSLTDPIGTDGEGNDISFEDILGSKKDALENLVVEKISYQNACQLLKKLNKRERIVISMRYGLMDGKMHAQHEVAEMLNISRSYVSRLEKKALAFLKEGLTK